MNNYTLWLISYDDAVYKQSTVTLCVPDVNVTNANCWKNGINNLEIHFFLIFEYPPSLTFCFFLSWMFEFNHVWELLAKTSVIQWGYTGVCKLHVLEAWNHLKSFCLILPLLSRDVLEASIKTPCTSQDIWSSISAGSSVWVSEHIFRGRKVVKREN